MLLGRAVPLGRRRRARAADGLPRRSVEHQAIRTPSATSARDFPDAYWRELDKTHAYPEAFVKALTEAGWLAMLIPEQYGGSGLGITEAAIVLEEINHSGGNAATAHAQMYIMGTLLRHGSDEQKQRYLPRIATGELRLQAFGVTEPDAGSETTQISTFAKRRGDHTSSTARRSSSRAPSTPT